MAAWPDWLDERIEMFRALEASRELETRLKEGTPEHNYATDQIAELEKALSEGKGRAEALIDKLYAINIVAATAARLRFVNGLMWKEVGFMICKSQNATRQCVNTAFHALTEEGTEAGEDPAPPAG